ncbi:MAG: AAA-like domain-containing protein [Parcubacteria group bacterium]
MSKEKTFKYDVLIGPEDLCNRREERKALLTAAKNGKRIILFAPRRYGKTSLIRNIVGEDFKKSSRKHILLNFDLMDVRSLEAVEEWLQRGLSQALSSRITTKKILAEIVSYLKGITVQISPSDLTGQPSIQVTAQKKVPQKNIHDYFCSILDIAKNYRAMIVLDEFHDIAFVPEAEGLFRMFLQELSDASVFILGSKRHLLKLMFQDAQAPLFHYGDEMHLKPIALDDWLPYFNERLSSAGMKIDRPALEWVLTTMHDVPNAICEVGAWFRENAGRGTAITLNLAQKQLDDLVGKKQSFAYLLQVYSEKEKSVLKAISAIGYVNEPSSEAFLKIAGSPKSTVSSILKKMLDLGVIEFELDKGYRISDPLLGRYLAK